MYVGSRESLNHIDN